MKNIDIIILNYNGSEMMRQCLPSVVDAARRSPVPCRVIVLDNKSTDESLDYVRKTFPHIKTIVSSENRVLFSYNDLIPKLSSDIVILLNNDVKVTPDFIAPLIKHFEDNEVFAVAPKQLDFNGNYNGGKNRILFSFGLIEAGPYNYKNEDAAVNEPGYTFYEANSAYDRRKFVELGGFDDIYAPFTWEDTDLAYRSWKSGYKFIYEPKSVIYHYESYTINREGVKVENRRIITRRNSFIFTWKNISDPGLLMQHLFLLPLNLVLSLFNDRPRIIAFIQALKYLPRIFKSRKRYPVSDAKVLCRNEIN